MLSGNVLQSSQQPRQSPASRPERSQAEIGLQQQQLQANSNTATQFDQNENIVVPVTVRYHDDNYAHGYTDDDDDSSRTYDARNNVGPRFIRAADMTTGAFASNDNRGSALFQTPLPFENRSRNRTERLEQMQNADANQGQGNSQASGLEVQDVRASPDIQDWAAYEEQRTRARVAGLAAPYPMARQRAQNFTGDAATGPGHPLHRDLRFFFNNAYGVETPVYFSMEDVETSPHFVRPDIRPEPFERPAVILQAPVAPVAPATPQQLQPIVEAPLVSPAPRTLHLPQPSPVTAGSFSSGSRDLQHYHDSSVIQPFNHQSERPLTADDSESSHQNMFYPMAEQNQTHGEDLARSDRGTVGEFSSRENAVFSNLDTAVQAQSQNAENHISELGPIITQPHAQNLMTAESRAEDDSTSDAREIQEENNPALIVTGRAIPILNPTTRSIESIGNREVSAPTVATAFNEANNTMLKNSAADLTAFLPDPLFNYSPDPVNATLSTASPLQSNFTQQPVIDSTQSNDKEKSCCSCSLSDAHSVESELDSSDNGRLLIQSFKKPDYSANESSDASTNKKKINSNFNSIRNRRRARMSSDESGSSGSSSSSDSFSCTNSLHDNKSLDDFTSSESESSEDDPEDLLRHRQESFEPFDTENIMRDIGTVFARYRESDSKTFSDFLQKKEDQFVKSCIDETLSKHGSFSVPRGWTLASRGQIDQLGLRQNNETITEAVPTSKLGEKSPKNDFDNNQNRSSCSDLLTASCLLGFTTPNSTENKGSSSRPEIPFQSKHLGSPNFIDSTKTEKSNDHISQCGFSKFSSPFNTSSRRNKKQRLSRVKAKFEALLSRNDDNLEFISKALDLLGNFTNPTGRQILLFNLEAILANADASENVKSRPTATKAKEIECGIANEPQKANTWDENGTQKPISTLQSSSFKPDSFRNYVAEKNSVDDNADAECAESTTTAKEKHTNNKSIAKAGPESLAESRFSASLAKIEQHRRDSYGASKNSFFTSNTDICLPITNRKSSAREIISCSYWNKVISNKYPLCEQYSLLLQGTEKNSQRNVNELHKKNYDGRQECAKCVRIIQKLLEDEERVEKQFLQKQKSKIHQDRNFTSTQKNFKADADHYSKKNTGSKTNELQLEFPANRNYLSTSFLRQMSSKIQAVMDVTGAKSKDRPLVTRFICELEGKAGGLRSNVETVNFNSCSDRIEMLVEEFSKKTQGPSLQELHEFLNLIIGEDQIIKYIHVVIITSLLQCALVGRVGKNRMPPQTLAETVDSLLKRQVRKRAVSRRIVEIVYEIQTAISMWLPIKRVPEGIPPTPPQHMLLLQEKMLKRSPGKNKSTTEVLKNELSQKSEPLNEDEFEKTLTINQQKNCSRDSTPERFDIMPVITLPTDLSPLTLKLSKIYGSSSSSSSSDHAPASVLKCKSYALSPQNEHKGSPTKTPRLSLKEAVAERVEQTENEALLDATLKIATEAANSPNASSQPKAGNSQSAHLQHARNLATTTPQFDLVENCNRQRVVKQRYQDFPKLPPPPPPQGVSCGPAQSSIQNNVRQNALWAEATALESRPKPEYQAYLEPYSNLTSFEREAAGDFESPHSQSLTSSLGATPAPTAPSSPRL